jgi:hypothetical protein
MTVVVQLFPDGCLPVSTRLFVLASQAMEPFLAQAVLLRETHSLPDSPPTALVMTAILCSSFLLCGDMFMGSWEVGTLHLGNSFSPH